MDWDWIPLLDFANCLKMITKSLLSNEVCEEYFEFTENDEKLVFSRQLTEVRIYSTFSSVVIDTTIADFEKAVCDFHRSISDYIRNSVFVEIPSVLLKYLY